MDYHKFNHKQTITYSYEVDSYGYMVELKDQRVCLVNKRKWKCSTNQFIFSTCLVIHNDCAASSIYSHIRFASFSSTSIEFNQKWLATSTPSGLFRISATGVADFLDSNKDFATSMINSMPVVFHPCNCFLNANESF